MKKPILIILLPLILLSACSRSDSFRVEGKIEGAADKILYLKYHGLLTDSVIDSLKLDSKGYFKFVSLKPRHSDFYKLTIDDRFILLGIDSTENIQIEAEYDNLLDAQINNSKLTTDLQVYRRKVQQLQTDYSLLKDEMESDVITSKTDSLKAHIEQYKDYVKHRILSEPISLASYFALFQQLDGEFILSPYNKADRPYFQSVATVFNNTMPDYARSVNLNNLVLDALKYEQTIKLKEKISKLQDKQKTGIIDFELKDQNGYPKKLSDYIGRAVVLDFLLYSMPNSKNHVFDLQDFYEKYRERGLEIYQVSVDQNRLEWEHKVSQRGWVCVNDETGKVARLYNIQKLPTLFLISKSGEIIGKYLTLESLEKDVEKAF